MSDPSELQGISVGLISPKGILGCYYRKMEEGMLDWKKKISKLMAFYFIQLLCFDQALREILFPKRGWVGTWHVCSKLRKGEKLGGREGVNTGSNKL